MFTLRKTVAALGATALLASPLALAAPAQAADREFRCGGAEVDFDVEKDDRRFEVEVDVDDAKPGSRYRVTLRHNGKVFHKKVHRADSDGDVVDIEKKRRDTRGKDRFKVTVKKIGGPKACSRVIKRR
ncbi:hypothetical protein IEQ44_03800 [Nocardioides sp. Y6]|uniref:Uncharacterized protein n=1 Tax=Nocardioides malaquae TaxID=2773426 RepID=A0ABR9RQC5_9ACTN|nr:hypothetical protein [Nocardioides malaquae]MBE7323772.1 hypothetical protein [Nocardioides malaquae]